METVTRTLWSLAHSLASLLTEALDPILQQIDNAEASVSGTDAWPWVLGRTWRFIGLQWCHNGFLRLFN